jgi:hypothetical protein
MLLARSRLISLLGLGAALGCSGEASSVAGVGGSSTSSGASGADAGSVDASPTEPTCSSVGDEQPARSNPNARRGPALVIGELDGTSVSVVDSAGSTGLDGAAYLVQSRLGPGGPITTPAALSSAAGKLCMAGNTVIVPVMSFAEYWGAEITLYLKRANDGAVSASDAGAVEVDASLDGGSRPSATEPALFQPWDPAQGNVIGLSFVVEGNDPSLPCGGLPPVFRFEGVPTGGDPASDIFCRDLEGLVSGQTQDVLFSEILRECWEPGGRGIISEPRPAGYTGELRTLSWLVPADENFAYAFNLCISDIRPLLAE